ncbi:MAG: type IV secretion system protein [Sulfuricella sp.]
MKAILLLLLLIPGLAAAAAPITIPDTAAGTIFANYAHSQTMFSAAQTNASAVNNIAMGTMGGLMLISLSWLGIRMALGRDHHSMTQLVETVLEIGIFMFLFQQYSMVTGTIIDSMQALAGVVSGGDANAAGGAKIMMQAGVAELNAIGAVMGNNGLWAEAGNFLLNIPQEIILCLAACGMLLASTIYVLMYFIGDAMAAVAISLGPLFVALGVTKWTRGYFDGWVKTLMTSLGYKVVGACLVGLMSHTIQNVAGSFANTTGITGYVQDMVSSLSALTFSILCMYTMFKVPELASSLFGAGLRAGSEVGNAAKTAVKAAAGAPGA